MRRRSRRCWRWPAAGESTTGPTRCTAWSSRAESCAPSPTATAGASISTSRAASAVLLAAAAVVGVCVLLLGVAHVDDRFGVDHVSGSWLGLAAAVRDGVLYPPLHDDGFYGGTRWMPLPFV